MSSFFRWDENTQFVLPFLDIQQLSNHDCSKLSWGCLLISLRLLYSTIRLTIQEKDTKIKHSCLDFLGFLIGKMSIYAECKKLQFFSDDFLWANKKCI